MITSEQLDRTVDKFEAKPEFIDEILTHMESQQSILLDILVGTHAELLTEDELDYLLFLFLVMYQTAMEIQSLPVFTESQISQAEEKIWALINTNKNYDDLIEQVDTWNNMADLAEFIDLSIGPDTENEMSITDEGRIIMFAVLAAEAVLLSEEIN